MLWEIFPVQCSVDVPNVYTFPYNILICWSFLTPFLATFPLYTFLVTPFPRAMETGYCKNNYNWISIQKIWRLRIYVMKKYIQVDEKGFLQDEIIGQHIYNSTVKWFVVLEKKTLLCIFYMWTFEGKYEKYAFNSLI